MQRAETNIVGSLAAIQSGSPPGALGAWALGLLLRLLRLFAAIPLFVFSMRCFAVIPQFGCALKPASYLSHR
jgi:hypothetical protein